MAKSTDADDIRSSETEAEAKTETEADAEAEAEVHDEDAAPDRSEATDELWDEVGVDPIKIALPRDVVGYTLRAYRPRSQLTPTEVVAAGEDADEDDPFAARERARAAEDAAFAEELGDEATLGEDEQPEDRTEEEEEEPDDAEAEAEEPDDEEVPVFLSHRGKLLLFGTPEALVSFVGSDAPHDLAQLDTWTTLVKRIRPEDIVPAEEDVYELDLVVENLRGGHDSWNLPLLIGAGELARDLGYALRLERVVTDLTPGSPLDDLDEACRAAASGGIGGMLARRRLRRVGAQQASLGWRAVIGKISDAVDWRD